MTTIKRACLGLLFLFAIVSGTFAAPRSTPVTVVNGEGEPVPVAQAPEAIQHDLATGPFVVPSDRSLIIKFVSGRVALSDSSKILDSRISYAGPDTTDIRNHIYPTFLVNDAGVNIYLLNQGTYIVVPPDAEVRYGWTTRGAALDVRVLMINGDLVPVP